jgi:hypothetical protein
MHHYSQGNTLSEYALLSGLVILLAYSGLSLFGNNLSGLFQKDATVLGQNSLDNYFNTTLGNHSQGANGATGLASKNTNASLLNNTSLFTQSVSGGTNATSVEGGTGEAHVLASFDKAKDLQALADAETDPAIKAKLEKLAQDAYWIGGSQATYEYHQNGNTSLATLAQAMIDKKLADKTTANKALISIRDNENFLTQDLDSLLSSPNIPKTIKTFALQAANQVLTQSQNQYKKSYQSIPTDEIPDTGLRTPDTVDSTTGKKSIDLVIGEGNSLLEHNKINNVPVKTSIKEGQDTTNYAQHF